MKAIACAIIYAATLVVLNFCPNLDALKFIGYFIINTLALSLTVYFLLGKP